MKKKTIIKVMIILYVALMLVLPVGIYIMDYENAPAKWTLGINAERQSISLTGDPFALKEAQFNHHPLLIQQNKEGAFIEDLKLARPTRNELILIDKEKRKTKLVFSIIASTGNIAESVYIRSSFGVSFPRFSINNDPQLLTEQSTYDSSYVLSGEQQLYLDLTYKKIPMSEKWSSFWAASSVSAGKMSQATMPYVVRSFQLVGKIMSWVAVSIWKGLSWIVSGVASGVNGLWTYAMDHRGEAWQATKDVTSVIIKAIVISAQFIFKIIAYIVIGFFKILWTVLRFVFMILRVVIVFLWQVLSQGAIYTGKFLMALAKDGAWLAGEAWTGAVRSIHYQFAEAPEERRLMKLSMLMRLPAARIGVAESVTVDFLCLDFQGNPAANRAISLKVKSKVQTDYILLSPQTLTTDEYGRFDVRLQTGRDSSTYHINIDSSKQRFHARLDVMPTKPTQIVSLKDQLTYVAPIGTLIKDAFRVKVYDRHQNPVPFAKVDWYTLVPGVSESVKFLEARTDRNGYLRMDYRMDDMSRSYWVQAHLVGTNRRLNYNMQSLAVNPENMVPVGDEDRQIIVGTKMSQPFGVKITDHFDNPVPNILVSFILQDDQQEEVVEKQLRTNRKGQASIRINTPTRPGEYSLLVSSEKMPDSDIGFTIQVQPGNVATIKPVTGNQQSAFWGGFASKPVRIRAVDSMGNPIAGLPVKWMGDAAVAWEEIEPETDDDGYASARVGAEKTELAVLHPIAEVAGQQIVFDLYPKAPPAFSLYLESAPVMKVIAGQRLPSDIDLVLRDQYGKVLSGKSIGLEYTVIRAGVTYQQNQTGITNKAGHVTFNFAASDKKDEINVKAKYFNGKDTVMTWIKIDVVPSGISRLEILPKVTQAVVGQKLDRPIKLELLDQKGSGMPGIPLDIIPVSAPGKELKNLEVERQKTSRQGAVFFFPTLGKLAGDYVYQVKMMKLDERITVRAVADRIETLSIRPPKQRSFVAGSISREFMVRALDQYGNPAIGSSVLYGVVVANMKAKVGANGFARLVVPIPKSASTYKLLITDEEGRVKTSTPLRVHESAVGSVRWLGEDYGLRVRAGATLKQDFPYQVIDKYGNALSSIKMNMDIYNKSRTTTLLGVAGETKTGGEGRFSVTAPKKIGRYWIYIYPSDWSDMGRWVTFDVVPAEVDLVQIVTGDNQLIHGGSQAPTDFMLSMADRYGNPVSGQDVNWVYQVKQGAEGRFLNTVTKTNARGVAAFNLVMDKEPGVRELKAYFQRQGKKDKQSFYYKILSNEVGQLQILTGRDQKVSPGRQLPQPIRIRLVNRVGAPIGDAVVRFDIESVNSAHRGALQELSVHTNPQGVASAFLMSPSLPGKYKIRIFSVKNPQISSVALLTVL